MFNPNDPRYTVEVFYYGTWEKQSEFNDYADAVAYGYYLLGTNEAKEVRVCDLQRQTVQQLRTEE